MTQFKVRAPHPSDPFLLQEPSDITSEFQINDGSSAVCTHIISLTSPSMRDFLFAPPPMAACLAACGSQTGLCLYAMQLLPEEHVVTFREVQCQVGHVLSQTSYLQLFKTFAICMSCCRFFAIP
jgi:hypothetical protein